MCHKPLLLWCLAVLAVSALAAGPLQAQKAQAPCQELRAACQRAGFTAGGAKEGAGILIDCIAPIIGGTAQRPKAKKPLPQIDLQIVEACKAANPSFGQPQSDPKGQPRQKRLPPGQASRTTRGKHRRLR